MDVPDEWKTRREYLIEQLLKENRTIDLKTYMTELEYPSKHMLIEDIRSIKKTLQSKGKKIEIIPPYCMACGFIFKMRKKRFKIPSKCPKCHEERISWPMIKIENS
ncbi:MAG: transcriptional regulator [Candidatus Lokiarchaeota archaeon]|nr:transcriptional regulator [Candidatus Lokiarchaeota archaeon]